MYEQFESYEYTNYPKTCRRIGELIKRANEIKFAHEIEQKKIKAEEDRIRKEAEMIEQMRLEEERAIEFALMSADTKPFAESFIESLKTVRKTKDYEFIAKINPDSTTISYMTEKLGEASVLQSGIDSEDRQRKIKIYERYLEQQEKLKAGQKLKKPKAVWSKSKKTDAPVIPELPSDPDVLIELTKPQLMQYKNIWEDAQIEKPKAKSGSVFVLDPWQSAAIDCIRSKKSCFITGPTSGGKTYVMMKAMDNMINTDGSKFLCYVGPTFHIVYQSYSNIKATFPNRQIAIITAELIYVPKDANIFIGTSCDLLNYFQTHNRRFNVGIFDEIHVAASLYYDTSSELERIRARSYARLISLCDDQIIAASATVKNEESIQQFIADMMNIQRPVSLSQVIPADIELIRYTERAIPLTEYTYNDESIIPVNRDAQGNDTNIQPHVATINASNLFKLLQKMKEQQMTPTIVFDNNDDNAWETYVNLINFCEQMESKDYKNYADLVERINRIGTTFNTDRQGIIDTIPENDNCDQSRKRDGVKGNGRREAGLRSIGAKRLNAINKMIDDCKTMVIRAIIQFNTTESSNECLCKIALPNMSKQILSKVIHAMGVSKAELIASYPNFVISHAHLDMLDILDRIESLNIDSPDTILSLPINKGSYYRFSKSSCGMDLLTAIREPGSDEEKWKHRKRMISLAEAQNIQPKDIDGIIDVVMRGLQFGLAIINPSLPFVIQNIILDNLRSKDMGVVFASESMSMGINYPLRSVVIKSMDGNAALLPAKMIQMAGRCGRRGKDTEAHVIYWGISNVNQAHHNHIDPINYPEHFAIDFDTSATGCIISDHEELALRLGEIHMTKYFDTEKSIKKTTKVRASDMKNGGRVKHTSESNNPKSSEDYEEERERKLCESRSEKVVLKRSMFLEPAVLALAKACQFTEQKAIELADMVCKIDEDIIYESYSVDSFKKSRDISLLMNACIEVHNKYTLASNDVFLQFIKRLMHLIQACEYRLIKLAK